MAWRNDLIDEQWALIEPFLPSSGRGGQWRDHRQVVNGILWQLRAGGPGILKENRQPSIQNGLYGIAAELARLTGWTYFDARQYNQARSYFTEALQLAQGAAPGRHNRSPA